jgi:hypothetical protein
MTEKSTLHITLTKIKNYTVIHDRAEKDDE